MLLISYIGLAIGLMLAAFFLKLGYEEIMRKHKVGYETAWWFWVALVALSGLAIAHGVVVLDAWLFS